MNVSRREFMASASSACLFAGCRSIGVWGHSPSQGGACLGRPSESHLKWADLERGMFFHFDISLYSKPGWDWRSFKDYPDAKLFNPKKLDTDQWMEAAKAMGAKYCVLVAKHCTGFLQWQSDLYDYTCKQAINFDGGKGDLVRRFVDSCRRYGMQPGLYASVSANGYLNVDNPGRVNRGKGGDPAAQKRYNTICEKMCEELWTRYGELGEIWFDGGALAPEDGGPDLVPILEKYQPNAILFQGPAKAKNLIRWVGNERGVAPYPCWSRTNTLTSEGGDRELAFHGDFDGRYWAPGECDVPIRPPHFMWQPTAEGTNWRYWTKEELLERYYFSVGRNCNLLLNANPDPDGLVPENDFRQFAAFGKEIEARFGHPLAVVEGAAEIRFSEPTRVNQIAVQEDLRKGGERVRTYRVEVVTAKGETKTVARGQSIGHKRIQMFAPEVVRVVRIVAETMGDTPAWRSFAAYSVADEKIYG